MSPQTASVTNAVDAVRQLIASYVALLECSDRNVPIMNLNVVIGGHAMAAVNEEVATVLKHLPADGTLEDVQYGLYVLEKVKRGLPTWRRGARSRRKKSNNAWPNGSTGNLVSGGGR